MPRASNRVSVLVIGRAEDPEEVERAVRERDREAIARRRAEKKAAVTQPTRLGGACSKPEPLEPIASTLEAVKVAISELSQDDFTAFKLWFRGYGGG